MLLVIMSVPPLLKIPPPSPRANPMELYAAVLLVTKLFITDAVAPLPLLSMPPPANWA